MNTQNNDSSTTTTPPPLARTPGPGGINSEDAEQCRGNTETASEPESAPPEPVVPVVVADDLDPELYAQLKAEAESATSPPPLRTRRVEIRARTGSFLRKLTHDQQNQLFLWLREDSVPHVADLVAAAPPAGFGLRVQHTTLRRIRAMMATMAAEDDYENSALAADSLSETIEANRVDFAPVISNLLLQKTFDLARAGTVSPSDLKDVIASFVKLRELELKSRRLLAETSHPHRDSAPRRHHVDLNIIPPTRPANQPPAVQFEVLPRANSRQIGSPDTSKEGTETEQLT